MSFVPMLDGEAAERAEALLGFIAGALERPPAPYEGKLVDEGLRVSLASREPGFALFYAYLHQARPHQGFDELALSHLEVAQEHFGLVADSRPYFAYGFTGLAWAMEHVRRLIVPDGEDPLEEFDATLLELVAAHRPTDYFSWRNGLAGYAVYALERAGSEARRCLEQVVANLAAMAEPRRDGLAWRTRAEWLVPHEGELHPGGACATSMPDGAIGPVLAAAAAAARGVSGAETLRAEGARWLLAQRLPDGRFRAYEDGPVLPSPAWFGGQLGLAVPLWLGGGLDETRRAELERLALDAFASATVRDASIAEGSAGLAHLALRLHRRGGDPRFAGAARQWLLETLRRHDPRAGWCGYRFHVAEEDTRYIPELSEITDDGGLLRGIAGIGLALLTAQHPVGSGWDRALLLSAD